MLNNEGFFAICFRRSLTRIALPWNGLPRRLALELGQELVPIHARQLEGEQNECRTWRVLIRRVVPQKGQRLMTSTHHRELHARRDGHEDFLQQTHLCRLIFHEE